MDSNVVEGDRLFLIAENLAQDFSRLPTIEAEAYGGMRGLVSRSSIARRLSACSLCFGRRGRCGEGEKASGFG